MYAIFLTLITLFGYEFLKVASQELGSLCVPFFATKRGCLAVVTASRPRL